MWKLRLMLSLLAVLCTAPRSHQFKISAANEVNPVDVIAKRSATLEPGCVGCPFDLDITQPSTIQLAYDVVDLINDGLVYKVVDIQRVTEQVVAGMLYDVYVIVSICDPDLDCYLAQCDIEAYTEIYSEKLILKGRTCVASNRR